MSTRQHGPSSSEILREAEGLILHMEEQCLRVLHRELGFTTHPFEVNILIGRGRIEVYIYHRKSMDAERTYGRMTEAITQALSTFSQQVEVTIERDPTIPLK